MSDTNESLQIAPVSAVVVLAAGGGTRMKSSKSKLLHEVGGRSMLSYAVDAAEALEPEHLVVVVGHQREQVLAHLSEIAPNATTAVQHEQKGTGHAVQCGLADLGELGGEIVVTYGDVPMLRGDTLVALVSEHRASGNKVTVLTAVVDNPFGYGRILRDPRDPGQVEAIVEQKDATEEQRLVREINSGIYVFDAQALAHGLANITTDNAQGELYPTDVLGITRREGGRVGAHVTDDVWQTEGVNDRVQLAAMHREMNRRIVDRAMRAGVTVLDPNSTWIEDGVDLAQDVTLLPGTQLQGATSVASGAIIGPDTTLLDCEVGAGATVTRSHCQLAVLGEGCVVGPFASLRPGTDAGNGAHIGSFTETRAICVPAGAMVGPLATVSDQTEQQHEATGR